MKKSITILALLLTLMSAKAQSMYDGIAFSENNYYGTARSMGLGNAVTALGGDLGMIGINPAGSAVSSHSQFAVTPGVGINCADAAYTPVRGEDYTSFQGETRARFALPNAGLCLNFNTGHEYGLRSVHFAITANRTNQYLNSTNVKGINTSTSVLGAFAEEANYQNMPTNIMWNSPWSSGYSWNAIAAYGSNGIGYTPTYGKYVGSTQPEDGGLLPSGGSLDQYSSREFLGSKTDLVVNFGFNISDELFLGANLGIPILSYSYREILDEQAREPMAFPVNVSGIDTYFNTFNYTYTYNAGGAGVYGKFGVIYLPFNGLRVGAAFQTPSLLSVTERWSVYDETYFTNREASASCGPSAPGESDYNITTPYEMNVGVAYTFGSLALLSVDYEFMDYGIMNFKSRGDSRGLVQSVYDLLNRTIRLFSGFSHSVRVGGEVNVSGNVALRAGFSMLTSPEKYYTIDGETVTAANYDPSRHKVDKNKAQYFDFSKYAYNIGVGYKSNGSFFADLAGRLTTYPATYFSPYADYLQEVNSPEVRLTRKLFDIALTVGWRF